jgi:hypothetical protein
VLFQSRLFAGEVEAILTLSGVLTVLGPAPRIMARPDGGIFTDRVRKDIQINKNRSNKKTGE